MASKTFSWLNERLGLETLYNTILDRKVPKVNWWFTLGSASLFMATMQALTGIFLTIYYVPSPDHAYDSVQYIMNGVDFGWLIRGMHHWGATLMVILVFLHMLRTFYYAAYKYPRELTWVTGVVLLLSVLGMGLTGYLLPWNQKSYWATTVATEIIGTVPFVGPFLMYVARGGTDLSAVTLARFFSVHIWIIPAIVATTIGIHLYLIVRLGISHVPDEDD
jgi:quinol-cytochrome oxidoreductase complex cytochrome b subunit